MSQPVQIGQKRVGADLPVYVIGEIGINHNGDLDIARKLIDVAARRSSFRSALQRSAFPSTSATRSGRRHGVR
jgi:sialic acid synthase SpsE